MRIIAVFLMAACTHTAWAQPNEYDAAVTEAIVTDALTKFVACAKRTIVDLDDLVSPADAIADAASHRCRPTLVANLYNIGNDDAAVRDTVLRVRPVVVDVVLSLRSARRELSRPPKPAQKLPKPNT